MLFILSHGNGCDHFKKDLSRGKRRMWPVPSIVKALYLNISNQRLFGFKEVKEIEVDGATLLEVRVGGSESWRLSLPPHLPQTQKCPQNSLFIHKVLKNKHWKTQRDLHPFQLWGSAILFLAARRVCLVHPDQSIQGPSLRFMVLLCR